MNGTPLLLAIIGHLVGDYLLQTDWMALNKKQRSFPCFVHAWIWTLSVCLFAGWDTFSALLPLSIAHFIQDRTNLVSWWMRLKWKNQSEFMRTDQITAGGLLRPGLGPWSVIVVDNVWHIVSLWFVWRFLT